MPVIVESMIGLLPPALMNEKGFDKANSIFYDTGSCSFHRLAMSAIHNNKYVTSISGVFSDIQVLSSEDALHSIYSVKSLIGLEDPATQLILEREDESSSEKYYTFQQYYDNVKVWMGLITVSVDQEGKTCSLKSTIMPTSILEKVITTTKPKLSENEITTILRQRYPKATDISSTLVIYSLDKHENPVLAYFCIASSTDDSFRGMVILINANTEQIIQERSTSHCPYCSNMKVLPGFNSFKVKHTDLMDEWDSINNYLL